MAEFIDTKDLDARRRAPNAGVTLIEMMVVLVMISVVAALIVPNVIGRPDEARVTVVGTDLRSIAGALQLYRLDNGAYPTTAQGLAALAVRPVSPPLPRSWPEGGYLSTVPLDPWGAPYVYRAEGARFDLVSHGADSAPGGEGVEADISLRQETKRAGQ
ncbi:General secretion pathway protein G [Candidatus Rhodobacter oscarellae]|uniref:Type II secretion system core protein G n=1 Tax=Candidatus Rhodobacter oscarellae TaxID=1675527 RepID=A0A0J9E9E1_9RHOB|nr:type II secretion system major pseudopilin GspG [Candidatus Rhodobacter lobularis]KMW59412.1 General secretion pathway protein G [Candidatus Rhodobacter lobularis]